MRADPALEALCALARKQHYVVQRRQAGELGLSADRWRGRLGGRLVPLLRGTAMVSVPGAPAAPTLWQWAQSALLSAPDGALLCAGSGLRVHGVEGTPFRDPEHVAVGATAAAQSRPGLVRHRVDLTGAEPMTIRGLATVGLRWALWDGMRRYDREHAVSVVDSALHTGRITQGDLAWLDLRLRVQRRGWLALADGRAESPLETRGRLFLLDRKLPFEAQVVIDVPGFGTARADFRVGRRVIVECDGRAVHDELSARYADRRREDGLRALGFEVVRVTWGDLVLRPDETYARICAALARVG